MGETTDQFCQRDIALLHAVADHRCEILHGSQLVLYVDGRVCCDGDAGRRLIRGGWLARPGLGSGRWPARLTKTGEVELAQAVAGRATERV
jgi:hypothetical protein